MYIPQHGKIKFFKYVNVMLTVLHYPPSVGRAPADCTMIKRNINRIWIAGLNPVLWVKNWKIIKNYILAYGDFNRVLH